MWRVLSIPLLVASFAVMMFPAALAAEMNNDVKQLLIAADKLMGQGRSNYQDALSKYSEALVADPQNVRGLASRAELYSMMRQREKALEDLGRLLTIDPKHKQGLTLRVKLLSQVGDLKAAIGDQVQLVQFYKDKKQKPKMEEALAFLDKLRVYSGNWEEVESRLREHEQDKSSLGYRQANVECVRVLANIIVHFAKDHVGLRLKRAECALAARDRIASSDELKFIVTREPQNLYAASLNVKAFRSLGATEQAKSELKRCLALDPEFGPCMKLHKTLRLHQKIVSALEESVREKKWDAVLTGVDEAFTLEHDAPNADQLWRWRCEAYAGLRDVEKGLEVCETLLQLENGDSNPQMYDVYLIKADLYILNEDLAAAQVAVGKASELQPNNDRVREYQQKMERLKRASERKDYYKILGVSKTAGATEIRRSYRKLTKEYHPDHLRSKKLTPEEREKMDKLYRDINEAKEVLLDEEKRRRFDNGEDVTKPPEQQGGGPFHGSPFNFNFGGGGGHHQQFHFNFG